MIQEVDLLLWRTIFLAMVSNYIKEARKDPNPVGFTLEQPASPKDYKPEVVSFWDTKQWASLEKEFGWEETTFAQGQYGGSATKPTTFGGNLRLEVNNRKRMKKAGEGLEVKSSKDLSRWAPCVMAMVAEALTTQVMQRNPMLRPLSWDEHIAHGHTPYRRDCAVCQQAVQQCHPRRKVPYPVGGVLSLDVAGPLIPAKDIGGLYARWMLVGTLTWAVPAESEKMKILKFRKQKENEPHFEVYPEDEEEKDEDNAKEGQEEAAGEEKDGEDPMEVWAEEDEVKEGGGGEKRGCLGPRGSSA